MVGAHHTGHFIGEWSLVIYYRSRGSNRFIFFLNLWSLYFSPSRAYILTLKALKLKIIKTIFISWQWLTPNDPFSQCFLDVSISVFFVLRIGWLWLVVTALKTKKEKWQMAEPTKPNTKYAEIFDEYIKHEILPHVKIHPYLRFTGFKSFIPVPNSS